MTASAKAADVYAARRNRVLDAVPDATLCVVPSGRIMPRNGDADFPFRQDSTFHFLTGFNEPDALLLLWRGAEGERKATLFVQPKDPEKEVWTGRRLGPEDAVDVLGMDEGFDNTEIAEKLQECMDPARHVAYELGRHAETDAMVIGAARRHWTRPRLSSRGPDHWMDLARVVSELRLVKDDHDIALLRRSAGAAVEGHLLGMRTVRPGQLESQLQGAIEYGFAAHGGQGTAYNSIVASGDNATILHYDANNGVLRDGDLVLIDAGCEIECMASDITRTYPINGRFTAPQADLYDLVLAAQAAAFEKVHPGSNQEEVHTAAYTVLAQGMIDLGFFKDEGIDEILSEELYKRWYMHRTGHWLGLDVHDIGRYHAGENPRPFEPGMVCTVEPGLYVSADDETAPEAFRGIGIRIEDDVLTTADGHENLTAGCPKARNEIEALMREGSPLEPPILG